MTKYDNKSGNSSVDSYQIGADYIKVKFNDGRTYLYNRMSPGKNHVEEMKKCALSGKGLGSYIKLNLDVFSNYAAKY